MTRLQSFGSASWALIKAMALCLLVGGCAQSQVRYPDEEIQVHDLPSLTARSPRASDLLLASLETVFRDQEVCCGKDSALEDSVAAADPESLKDVASKLQGRHLLSDGRPILVTATYVTPDAVNSGLLIGWFQDQHAALMRWNSRIYVVRGIVYTRIANPTPEGPPRMGTLILKFLLWDTRFPDSRRKVVFNRETDDLSKVEGFLFLDIKPQ
jgi:hypothetical protein